MKLSVENLKNTAAHCLFRDDELTDPPTPPNGAILIDGIVARFAFHSGRVVEKRADIAAMLDKLPDEFKSNAGGGMSFLNACVTKDGERWGEYYDVEMLFALGEACELSKPVFPREMWSIMPGGMPYMIVDTDAVSKFVN